MFAFQIVGSGQMFVDAQWNRTTSDSFASNEIESMCIVVADPVHDCCCVLRWQSVG